MSKYFIFSKGDTTAQTQHPGIFCFALIPSSLQSLKGIRADHRVLLTGTPLQNNLAELFMLLAFLDKDKFGKLQNFEDQFVNISQEEQVLQSLSPLHLLSPLYITS